MSSQFDNHHASASPGANCPPDPATQSMMRLLAQQALSRTAGAPLVAGNSARILKDADAHYPAWLAAIRSARRSIFFENYIFADDDTGRQFIAALAARAGEGVRVRLIYDWLGSFGSGARLWQPLIDAGGEVRCFNPPHLASPFGWLTRDHRKLLCVDGRIGFVTGLCVSDKWLGNPAKGIAPWRDTGIEVSGPVVADLERAFAQTWAETGTALAAEDFTDPGQFVETGEVAMRVLPTMPSIASMYRLDHLIAVMARERLWLTDAYFVGISPYVQALRAAAQDGVDVRLLVPGSSDLALLSPLSRSGYRPLLEAGVRLFEWNGSMLHAKTAVADGRWARIGSTNLNIASWLGNHELDVTIEDRAFAQEMERMYEEDLANATEIVLDVRNRVSPTGTRAERSRRGTVGGSTGRVTAGALRIGNSVGAAITGRRELGPAESSLMTGVALVLIMLAMIGFIWPLALALPIALLALWSAIALLLHVRTLRATRKPPS